MYQKSTCNQCKKEFEYYPRASFGKFCSRENYEKQRKEYFAKYGYKTIFIRTEDIENERWRDICLLKIKEQ